jgi:hypothetical protein
MGGTVKQGLKKKPHGVAIQNSKACNYLSAYIFYLEEVSSQHSFIPSSKVETPYHDNDLILTPTISPQSGWQ